MIARGLQEAMDPISSFVVIGRNCGPRGRMDTWWVMSVREFTESTECKITM